MLNLITLSTSLALLLSSTASAQTTTNIPTLPEAIQQIPTCARSALADAMNKEGCPTSSVTTATFDCVLNVHFNSIIVDVTQASGVSQSCLADFANAWGTAKGVWQVGPPQSDLDAAASALASEVGGSSSSGGSTSSTASVSAQGGATPAPSASSSSSSSHNAAAPTAGAGTAFGLIAPAVAVGAFFL